ncbi:MAG: SdrD B-like domain-containing protein, partial [Cyanobacteria bacterium J06582_2]
TNAGVDFVDELGHISGNVKSDDDDNGTGDTNLENVRVELIDIRGNLITSTTTDSDGNYEFSGITPGDYQVKQVNLTGYGDVTPTVLDVTIGAGETSTGNDFIDELGHISGNVKSDDDDNGTGDTNLENVTVELLDRNGDIIATTITDSDGNYEFSGVTPGNYRVKQTNLTGYGDVTPTVLDVTIGEGETNTGNDFVDELGRIAGNVKSDDNNDNIGDTDLENVTVELLDSNGDVMATTTTNTLGNYEFDSLLPGDYQVRQVNLAGYGDVTETILDVTLGAGETNTGNNFVDELGQIGGNVKVDDDDDGTGDRNLENVTVELLDNNGDVIATTTTNTLGNYEFSGITPGDYQVRQINLTGYGDVTPTVLDVTIGAGETVANNNFVDELGHITGSVTSDNDDNGTGDTPLANVTVELIDSKGDIIATTTTDDAGNYEFSGVTPGDYQVRQVNLTGYGDVTPTIIDLSIDAGETNDGVNFIDELGRIAGSVTADEDDDGTGDTGLEGVTVELLDRDGNIIATTTTDDAGNYEFSGVTPGDYQVRQVNLTGYGDVTPTVIDLSIDAGETNDGANFIDEEFGEIAGSVLIDNDNNDSGDAPLENVTINLIDSTGTLVASTTTDSEGNYEFTNITPGEYTVEQVNLTGYGDVSDRDGENLNQTILTLSAGATETANFVDELGRISGNVTSDDDNDDLSDTNLANVTVELLDGDGNLVQTALTDVQGNYEFQDLLAGDYQVKQTNLDGYGDVNELDSNQTAPLDTEAETADADNDNLLAVALAPGEADDGNDFVDEQFGSLLGNVSQDTTGDGLGNEPLADVTLSLLNENGVNVGTTTTDAAGNYSFGDLAPGIYTVVETSPDGLVTVAENEGGADNDRSNNGVLSSIEALVSAGENDLNNDFVEAVPAEINGRVWGDRDRNGIEGTFEPGIAGVTVELLQNGEVIGSTISDSNGVYQFTEVTPGDGYRVLFDSTSFPNSYQGGFTTADVGDSTTDSDVINFNTGVTTLFNLGPAALLNDVDAGLLEPELNQVDGTASPDLLVGTAIGDAIAGYKGQDTLTGGDGNDRFIYTETSDGVDIITDFTTGEDQIDLRPIMNQELGYTGTDAIADGLVVIEEYDSVGSMIQVDFDGAGDLLPKDVVFLDGVTNINPNTDLLF